MRRKRKNRVELANPSRLSFLQPEDVFAIDHAMESVGGDGQVHLVVEEGRLSYIQTLVEFALASPAKRTVRAKRK